MAMTDEQRRRIQDLGAEEDRSRAQLAEAKGRLEAVQTHLKKALGEAYNIHPFDVELGGWRCSDSPTGWCFYDRGKDRALDFCIICGGPDERK